MPQDLHQRAKLESELRARIAYDPESGAFTRLKDGGNGARVGGRAGGVAKIGYVYLSVCDTKVLAHRAAWFLTHGRWPGVVDHVNGNRSDNRLCNLREVTTRQNTHNVRSARNSSGSGLLGAFYDKRRGRWFASIMNHGRSKFLGYHASPEAAHAAYVAAKRRVHEAFVE